MIYKVYSVFDVAVSAFNRPVFLATKALAIRQFVEAVNDLSTEMGKYPDQYVLFEIGEFDDSKGIFMCHSAPVSIGVGIEFKNVVELAKDKNVA